MKIVLKTIVFSLIALVIFSATHFALDVSAFGLGKSNYLYLILGLDDTASNTDSILIASYNSDNNTASIIQLPRDTYCYSESRIKKINGIYSAEKARGSSDNTALRNTANSIADKLGVSFDGYLAFTLDDLIKLVDALGGVHLDLPEDLTFYDKQGNAVRKFNAGENVLSGEDAAFFVRHRSGYVTGDLGRLDAQKIFMSALIRTALKNTGIDELFDIAKVFSDGVVTNIKLREVLSMVLRHSSKFRNTAVTYITMPGSAVCSKDGLWYYVLNKNAVTEVLREYMGFDNKDFDKAGIFVDKNDSRFLEIYFSDDIKYEKYHSFNKA